MTWCPVTWQKTVFCHPGLFPHMHIIVCELDLFTHFCSWGWGSEAFSSACVCSTGPQLEYQHLVNSFNVKQYSVVPTEFVWYQVLHPALPATLIDVWWWQEITFAFLSYLKLYFFRHWNFPCFFLLIYYETFVIDEVVCYFIYYLHCIFFNLF